MAHRLTREIDAIFHLRSQTNAAPLIPLSTKPAPQIIDPLPLLPPLAPLPELFVLDKSQWSIADRAYFERDAVTGTADVVLTLANIAWTTNSIDSDPSSPTFGRQQSFRYRQGPSIANNARRMEPTSVLSWAYTLDKSWNPYFHHPILRVRLEASLRYWLSLQTKEGGMSENDGPGTMALAPTAFSFELLVDMQEQLDTDGTIDPLLRGRLRNAIVRAAQLCATDMSWQKWGYGKSNQYAPVFYILWRLYQITQDAHWKQLYDARLTEFLAHAQTSLFWHEIDGVETFSYSHVTEWELDKVYALNRDPRILESFRKYFEWCGLNTLPENDSVTFLMDTIGHTRTTKLMPSGQVGYYNHITQDLPSARPFAFAFLMTEEQREEKIAAWLHHPFPARKVSRAKVKTYHPFHAYPMTFSPLGITTVGPASHLAAVHQLPTLSQTYFTRYFKPPVRFSSYLFVRRPGFYATLHWGRGISHQAKELGLVWIPGFGTLLRSTNDHIENAYCTRMGAKTTTFKAWIEDFAIPKSFSQAAVDGSVRAGDLLFTTAFGGIGITKSFHVAGNRLEVSVLTATDAIEQIPLYLDRSDTMYFDGEERDIREDGLRWIVAGEISARRNCGGVVGGATLRFFNATEGTVRKGYDIANGMVWVLCVEVKPGVALQYSLGK